MAPLQVADAVVEDAIEQRLPFRDGTGRIALRQAQHRDLHDVVGVVGVAERALRDPEGASLDAGQESVKLAYLRCVQSILPVVAGCVACRRPARASRLAKPCMS